MRVNSFGMKRIVAVIAAALMLFALCLPAMAATPAESAKLHFDEDGKFRILNFSDFQDDYIINPTMLPFVKRAVQTYKPDLIVLTGDNISGYTCKIKGMSEPSIRKFMDVFEELGVPVASVFGNHDDQGDLTKEQQMEIYREYSCFIGFDEATVSGEVLNEQEMAGVGTYVVPVYESEESDTVKFAVWMFDSGSDDDMEDEFGYDCVHKDQLDWYARTGDYLNEQSGETVYGIAFQHIVPIELFDVLKKTDRKAAGAMPYKGEWYVLPDNAAPGGIIGEPPCPSSANYGQVDLFNERGDVLAIVCGHDHANSYDIPCGNIRLICTPTCGFQAHGAEKTRGARIIDLDLRDTSRFETTTILYTDSAFADIINNFSYKFINFWKELYLIGNNLLVYAREILGI